MHKIYRQMILCLPDMVQVEHCPAECVDCELNVMVTLDVLDGDSRGFTEMVQIPVLQLARAPTIRVVMYSGRLHG